jgi:hypothetical protein
MYNLWSDLTLKNLQDRGETANEFRSVHRSPFGPSYFSAKQPCRDCVARIGPTFARSAYRAPHPYPEFKAEDLVKMKPERHFSNLMIGAISVVAFVMFGCANSRVQTKLLTYDQVKEVVSRPYPQEAKPIAELEEKVSRFRDQLTRAVGHRLITDNVAIALNRELAVADYFNTKSWAAMI